MEKKSILAALVMLSLLQGNVYAENITTQNPNEGTYDKIDRFVTGNSSDSGIGITSGGNWIVENGGSIILQKNASVAYGLRVLEGADKPSNFTVRGELIVNIENNYNDIDKAIGVWKFAGYDASTGTGTPDLGGKIELAKADIDVIANRNAYGLLAGDDFGGNSSGAGRIIINDNIDVNVVTNTFTQKADGRNTNRTFGALACTGLIELKGQENTFTVNSKQADGRNYHETAGLYVTCGGTIVSNEDSKLNLDVSGYDAFGISVGGYDITRKDTLGKSSVELKGKTIVNLNNSYSGTGKALHTNYKGKINASDMTVNFMDNDAWQNIGLYSQYGGLINVNTLRLGVEAGIKDPTKITAINLYGKGKVSGTTFENSGMVNVNADKSGTVQINGKIKAADEGIANINLSNADSYLYGNTQLNNIGISSNGIINLDISNGAKWTNVQSEDDYESRLTTLNLSNGGFVDLTDKTYNEEDFQKIYIEKEFNGGNGTIHMDIDASTNENNSDRVYVDGMHKGTHYITLNNVGANTDGAAGTVLVSVNNEQGNFVANDSEGTLYWNRYDLDSKESTTDGYNTDWYLKEVEQLDEPTTSVDTILGANALGYHTWRAETDKLMKRTGDLRHNGEDEKGAWFRVRGAEISRDGEASFENKYTVYELGYDEMTKKTDRFTRYQGASLSYIDGTSSFARGSGENDGKSIAFYTTEMRNKGHYLDLVFRIADMDSDYKVYDTNGNKITGEPENVGVSLSAEYGRKKVMDDNGWYIEPQGQLTVGYFGGDNYRAKYADQYIDVHQSGIPSVLGRIGFNIGRDIDENTNIYLKANLLHEFCGDYDVDMVDSAGNRRTESDTFNDTWFEYGIGAAIKTGKNNHIYFDFEKTAGGDFEKDWAWNAGMRWTF